MGTKGVGRTDGKGEGAVGRRGGRQESKREGRGRRTGE